MISIIIGILSGMIAGKLMDHKEQGCLVDLFLGLLGGYVGGHVLGWLGIEWNGMLGQVGTAVVGAVILLWIWAKVK